LICFAPSLIHADANNIMRLSFSFSLRHTGILILTSIILFACLGSLLGPDPAKQELSRFLASPQWSSPLGLDHLGRDMFARLAHATRLSLSMAVLSVLSAAITGTLIGCIAAWAGGWLERFLTAFADAVLALPGLLLVLLFVAFAPGQFWPLYIGLSLSLWVEYFRVVRITTHTLLASPQVEASRLLGFNVVYVFRRHVLPLLLPRLLTLMCFGIATAILAMSALGFIGVGIQPPTPELGVMMIELLPYYQEAPWLIGSAMCVLFMTLLSLVCISSAKTSS
jgi:peptide/nickel transport system permease protein